MNYSTALINLPLIREAVIRKLRTPADAWRICNDIQSLAQESFHVLSVDSRNSLINRHLVTLGLADSSLAHPREVFRAAVSDGASAIILVHNHPSGDPTPSAEDLRITRQLVEAGKVMGIVVMDHVIIGRAAEPEGDQPGRPAFLSMRETGLCGFT